MSLICTTCGLNVENCKCEKKKASPVERGVIKPCPFCGDVPYLDRSNFTYSIIHICDAVKSVIGRGKKKDVIAQWNKRAI